MATLYVAQQTKLFFRSVAKLVDLLRLSPSSKSTFFDSCRLQSRLTLTLALFKVGLVLLRAVTEEVSRSAHHHELYT